MSAPVTYKKIGVLTSGGDAPGMNCALRAVTRAALMKGVKVVGVLEGYKGLLEGNFLDFTERSVSNIIEEGGTILFSNRCEEFKTEEGMRKAVENCRKNGIDGIIAIGGDGTFRGATDLCARGIPTIGIPGTIDNDITSTEYTIGFDTALNTVIALIDRLRDTCQSHARCNVVEIMGRGSGYLALESGIATGASAVLITEIGYDEEEIFEKVRRVKSTGKRQFIVVIAESVPKRLGQPDFSERFSERFEKNTGVSTRFVRPAHVLRGGSPSLRDRLIATEMGCKAVDLLFNGVSNSVVNVIDDAVGFMDIGFALRTDNMFKGTLKEEDLEGYSEEQIRKMRAICTKRQNHIAYLYDIVSRVSN